MVHLCAGIRQLQLVLLKVALLLGVEVHVHVEFKNLLEPPEDQQNHRENMFYSASQMFETPCKLLGSMRVVIL